jgi:uncharacterized membrane protein YuzA (DUF378 family)
MGLTRKIFILLIALILLFSPVLLPCTIFTSSEGNLVLFGNNEDWYVPGTYIWTIPPKEDQFGVVYFGFDDLRPQGGINEKGLVYDVNALPESPLNPHPELPKGKHGFYSLLKKCSTVEEVIEQIKSFSWEKSWSFQFHVADRTGDAAVISVGPEGEIAVTRKEKGDAFLISTNFNRAIPDNGTYPCWRYDTAFKMLEKIPEHKALTPQYAASILKAVHQQGGSVNTVYSNVYDLSNGVIYLYHWHQFDEAVIVDVDDILKKRQSPIPIESLFTQKTVDRAVDEYRTYKSKANLWTKIFSFWILLTGVALIGLIWRMAHSASRHPLTCFIRILIVILFGPVGLLASMDILGRSRGQLNLDSVRHKRKAAIFQTFFDVAGFTLGTAVAFATFYLILPLNESSLLSLILRLYVLPLVTGLILFQSPILAFMTKTRYQTVIYHKILDTLTALNFALIGFLSISGILMDLTERHLAMRGPASPIFWAVISVGALTSIITLFPYRFYYTKNRNNGYLLNIISGSRLTNPVPILSDINLPKDLGALLLSFVTLSGSLTFLFSFL